MMLHRIIIAGSRTFTDKSLLYRVCDEQIAEIAKSDENATVQIISGGARGADKLAEMYARDRQFSNIVLPAQWNKYGKRAGMLRNGDMARMASKKDGKGVLIAFWDGQSRGTKNMIFRSNENNNIKVVVFRTDLNKYQN